MKRLRAIAESLLLLGVVYLVYEVMYFGYMFLIRMGLTSKWRWLDIDGYDPLNLEQASLYFLRDHPVEYTILSWMAIVVIMAVAILAAKGYGLEDMSIHWLGFANFLVSILIGLGLVFIINGALSFAADVTESNATYIPPQLYSTYDLKFLLITVGGAAPICEELFFRGLLLGRLKEGFGPTAAVILTAFVFSASHLNISQSFFIFPVGLLCGILVVKTGSVFAGIWLHITYNVVNICLAKMTFFQYNRVQLLVMILIGTALIYFGLAQTRTSRTNNPQPGNN